MTKTGPAANLTVEQFLERLAESTLLPMEDVRALRGRVPPNQAHDCLPLIHSLIQQHRLTKYQASQIYQGKGRDLVLAHYSILDKLGAGGMGIVYRARHRLIGREVALKVLAPAVTDKPTEVKRFQREVQAAARLSHPNIVAAYDAGLDQGRHFLVMEYVEGTDLSRLVRNRGPLGVARALDHVLQAARGLEHAHAAGIIHRDIKPSNLLLDKKGIVKVLDLGLARIESQDTQGSATELTCPGTVMGTCNFMAPEQAINSRQADPRSDVYSLGCTLYFLLAGRTVYHGQTAIETLLAHRDSPIPPLRAARPDVSDALEAIYQRMLAKQPADRYPSMTALAADLEACQAGETARRSPTRVTRLRPEPPRRRWWPWVAAAAVLVASGLTTGMLLFGPAADPPAATAADDDPESDTADMPGLVDVAVNSPERWKSAINLYRLVQPQKDAVSGKWRLEPKSLIAEQSGWAVLELPCLPPEEYDFRITFARLEGSDSISQILTTGSRHFTWEMAAGNGNSLAYFAGLTPGKANKVRSRLQVLQPYTSIVQVRKTGVKAYLDGKLVSQQTTDYRQMGTTSGPMPKNPAALGLRCRNQALFTAIDLLEVTGKAKLLRDGP